MYCVDSNPDAKDNTEGSDTSRSDWLLSDEEQLRYGGVDRVDGKAFSKELDILRLHSSPVVLLAENSQSILKLLSFLSQTLDAPLDSLSLREIQLI